MTSRAQRYNRQRATISAALSAWRTALAEYQAAARESSLSYQAWYDPESFDAADAATAKKLKQAAKLEKQIAGLFKA